MFTIFCVISLVLYVLHVILKILPNKKQPLKRTVHLPCMGELPCAAERVSNPPPAPGSAQRRPAGTRSPALLRSRAAPRCCAALPLFRKQQ